MASGLVLDSSAILAVILEEPGYEQVLDKIAEAGTVLVGAPTLLETAIVLSARIGAEAWKHLRWFLREAGAEVVPFSLDHCEAALDAFQRFGKGRHPASLNFGDCMSYATAQLAALPLLYTGQDFAKTDLLPLNGSPG